MGPGSLANGSGSSNVVDVAELIPLIRRVVGARVGSRADAEDLVQETLVRVLGAANRIDPELLEPYAIVTARNVAASLWRGEDRRRRNAYRLAEVETDESHEDDLIRGEEQGAMSVAMRQLSESERSVLLAHEVTGRDTKTLGSQLGLSPGAVSAQLHRTRARLRVEYLLALERAEPPTDRCRPVLLALSLSDKRRQRELNVARHLLECELCGRLSEPLLRRTASSGNQSQRVQIRRDADIVAARKTARELAAKAGFSRTDMTAIATAVSEIARNIVRFADRGEVHLDLLTEPRPGLQIIALDVGPGIADIERALSDGYSSYRGLGLGLPGARRLMDEFVVVSEVDRGTTVRMIKWRKGPGL
jgi:RNA polymerase sigma factor (sigma-70 family)